MQVDADVLLKDVKMVFDTNQFSSLKFCGPHTNPHGVRRLNKNFYMLFDTKLGHGLCVICQIPCACA